MGSGAPEAGPGYGVTHTKPEFEDAAALAREHGTPYQEVVEEILRKL